ncbi:MAG TPA: hypothetical protein VF003_00025 [Pseudonocardiaceae bacterium]
MTRSPSWWDRSDRPAAGGCWRCTPTWRAPRLTEAFAFLALTVFVDYFTHYAHTELDVPPAPPVPSEGSNR